MPRAGVLVVVRHLLHGGVRLRVLHLEPRDEHAAAAVRHERERDRPLGRDEREARVVENVVGVEEHGAGEAARAQSFGERLAPRLVLLRPDRERQAASLRSFSRHAGSSARNRRTRSPTRGCVTKSAASPSSMNGLIV